MRPTNLLMILFALFYILSPTSAESPLAVNIYIDSNDGDCSPIHCSLREAVMVANQRAGVDLITFDLKGTFYLTQSISIEDDLLIQGKAQHETIFQSEQGVFEIETQATVTIEDAEISKSRALPISQLKSRGGAILNAGHLTLNRVELRRNQALQGGAIYNSGTLTLTNVLIADNQSVESGGGIANISSPSDSAVATMTIISSTIENNQTGSFGAGGGIYNELGTLFLQDTRVTGNRTSNIQFGGGGIANRFGNVTIDQSLVESNSADVTLGGGISNHEGTVTISQTVIGHNEADFSGGGIFNAGLLNIDSSSIIGNLSNDGSGGGLFNDNKGVATAQFSSFDTNRANNRRGGGILNLGKLTLNGSIIFNNKVVNSSSFGGGIYNSGQLSLNASELSYNTAYFQQGKQYGGGIYSADGQLEITYTTFTNNYATLSPSAEKSGSAIYLAGGTIKLNNNCFSDNGASSVYSEQPFDAPFNWWGSADGSGDSVNELVNTADFRTAINPTCPHSKLLPNYAKGVQLLGRIPDLPTYDLAVIDKIAYLASGRDGFRIVDFSDLTNPKILSTYPVTGSVTAVQVVGQLGYLGIDHDSAELTGEIVILDLTDPVTPFLLGKVATPPVKKLLYHDGKILAIYGGTRTARALQRESWGVIDVSNSAEPQIIHRSSANLYDSPATAFAIQKQYLYVATSRNGAWLDIFYLPDLGRRRLSLRLNHTANQFHGMEISNGRLYLAEDGMLSIYNLRRALHPKLLTTFWQTGDATALALTDDTLYLLANRGTLRLYDQLSTLVSQQPAAIFDLPAISSAHAIALDSSLIFSAYGADGLAIMQRR